MADLKAGTTVGGALLWNASNLKLRPVDNGTRIFFGTNKIYTTGDKPTPEEIDTVSASRGGTYDSSVMFRAGVRVPSPDGTKWGGLIPGNKDNNTYAEANVDIATHFGLGILNSSNAGSYPGQRTIVFDARTGTIQSRSKITADAGGFWDGANRVWSNTAKPSNVDMNAVARTGGDTMTGDYQLTGQFTLAAGAYRYRARLSNNAVINLLGTTDGDVVDIGQNHSNVKGMNLSVPYGITPRVRWGGTGDISYAIYHEGNKPGKADVGLGQVDDAKQIKWAGDVSRAADFEFLNLKLAAAPTQDEHAVRLSYMSERAFIYRNASATASTDWNTLTEFGMYNAQQATGPNSPWLALAGHPGRAKSQWGIISVYRNTWESNSRIVQEFKSVDGAISGYRTFEPGAVSWRTWNFNWSQTENDRLYLSRLGDDSTSGSINLTSDASWYKQSGLGVICLRRNVSGASNVIVIGEAGVGNIELRPSTTQGLWVNPADTSNKYKVYHQGFKPDNVDVGLSKVLNVEQTPLVSTAFRGTSSALVWVKMAEVTITATGDSHFQFMSYGNDGVGAQLRPTDTVELSGRFDNLNPGTVTITAANIRNQMMHMTDYNTSGGARYGVVNKSGLIALWMKTPAWYTSSVKFSVVHSAQSRSMIEDAPYVTTEPAGIIYVPVDFQYNTRSKPGKADVGLDKVENYKALPIDGSQPLNGTLDITNAARSLYYQSKGFTGLTPATSGSTVVQWRGSYFNWNQDGTGSTDIINHPGAAAGGFKFWQGTPNSSAAFKQIAYLDKDGVFELNTVNPQVETTPVGNQKDTRPPGIQLMPLPATFVSGYPYTDFQKRGDAQMGIAVRFKGSDYRNMQIYASGSQMWFRNMRSDFGTGNEAEPWVETISANSSMDFGRI